jgi:hypothetical protein
MSGADATNLRDRRTPAAAAVVLVFDGHQAATVDDDLRDERPGPLLTARSSQRPRRSRLAERAYRPAERALHGSGSWTDDDTGITVSVTRDDNDVDHHDLGSDHDPRHARVYRRSLETPAHDRLRTSTAADSPDARSAP